MSRTPRILPPEPAVDRMIAALGGLGLTGSFLIMVRDTMGALEIAEEEIEAVFPERASQPTALFSSLVFPTSFAGKSPRLYRMHAREIVARFRDNPKHPHPEVATEAECLVGILHASQNAPLNTAGMLLAERLFTKVMDQRFEHHTREEWPGQYEEQLTIARRSVRTGR